MSDFDSEPEFQEEIEVYSKPTLKLGKKEGGSIIGGLGGLKALSSDKKKEASSFQLRGIGGLSGSKEKEKEKETSQKGGLRLLTSSSKQQEIFPSLRTTAGSSGGGASKLSNTQKQATTEKSFDVNENIKIVLEKIENMSSNFLNVIQEQNKKYADMNDMYMKKIVSILESQHKTQRIEKKENEEIKQLKGKVENLEAQMSNLSNRQDAFSDHDSEASPELELQENQTE